MRHESTATRGEADGRWYDRSLGFSEWLPMPMFAA
jgi:hypothetical protein